METVAKVNLIPEGRQELGLEGLLTGHRSVGVICDIELDEAVVLVSDCRIRDFNLLNWVLRKVGDHGE